MYFVKARKHFDEQDSHETQDKGKKDRYQRSDSARLLLQALPTTVTVTTLSPPQQPKNGEDTKVSSQMPDSKRRFQVDSSVDANDFKFDELPDAVCFRPKKDLSNLTTSPSLNSQPSSSGLSSGNGLEVKRVDSEETGEHVRPAEVNRASSSIDL